MNIGRKDICIEVLCIECFSLEGYSQMFSWEGRCRCSSIYFFVLSAISDQHIIVTLYVQKNTVILNKHFSVFRGG